MKPKPAHPDDRGKKKSKGPLRTYGANGDLTYRVWRKKQAQLFDQYAEVARKEESRGEGNPVAGQVAEGL